MKYLAIDYGDRRIGIASTDPSGEYVRPITTLDSKENPRQLDAVLSLIEEHFPDELVVGLPLDSEGEENERCAKIRSFCNKLLTKLPHPLPIHFTDESYTTVRSHEILRQNSGRKKRSSKGAADPISACIILQQFLQEKRGPALFHYNESDEL